MRRLAAVLAMLLVAMTPAFSIAAQVKGVDVQALERELRCPTCKAPLTVSDSPAADQIKNEIRRRLAAGQSPDEVKASLVKDFGRDVLATPPKEGFDLVAWVVPSVVVLLGLAAIPFVTRRWARRGQRRTPDPTEPVGTSDELARLDQALRDREG